MPTQQEMPKYKCHKIVWALEIAEIHPTADGARIKPADEGYGEFSVKEAYMMKHDPQVGGYYVVYEDGYKSWSPKDVFEAGYKPV